MISYLGIQTHEAGTYAEIKGIEDRLDTIHIGNSQYLPTGAVERVKAVLVELAGSVRDPRTQAALYELWLTTKSKSMNEKDRDALLQVYARRLGAYPPDVVELVLHDLSEDREFFPAWKEIADAIAPLCGWRTDYARAFRRALKRMKQ